MNEVLITIILTAVTLVVTTGSVSVILFLALLTWQMIKDIFL